MTSPPPTRIGSGCFVTMYNYVLFVTQSKLAYKPGGTNFVAVIRILTLALILDAATRSCYALSKQTQVVLCLSNNIPELLCSNITPIQLHCAYY